MQNPNARRILMAEPRRITGAAADYVAGRMSVLPTHADVFGTKGSLAGLQAILSKYPVVEWLSFLSRIQTILAAQRVDQNDPKQRVFAGAMGPRLREAMAIFVADLAKEGTPVELFYERQLTTLQQLAILHAPECGDAKLETDEGRDDLGLALLITADLMMDRAGGDTDLTVNLDCRIQDQIRVSLLPAPVFAGRAFHFYELDIASPSSDVQQYLSLFETATGVNAHDFVLGGLTIAILEEINLTEERYDGWVPVRDPEKAPTADSSRSLEAYLTLRAKSVSELRDAVRQFDGSREIRDWNLIALSMFPVVDLHTVGRFVLNLTAVGRSLFDGVRHAILTAARERRLPDSWNSPSAVGQLYGRIFERFVQRILEIAFPGRVIRVPQDTEERADFIIPFGGSVMVLEAKAEHFLGFEHAAFMDLEARRREIERVGIPKAISQIASTIRALRENRIPDVRLECDWTITPIVPVVVTDERLPQVPGCWEPLYLPSMGPLNPLQAAGPVAPLRLISLDDLEDVPDLRTSDDFGAVCLKWAHDRGLMDSMLPTYLQAHGHQCDNHLVKSRFQEIVKILAQQLGLDPKRLGPEYEAGHDRVRS